MRYYRLKFKNTFRSDSKSHFSLRRRKISTCAFTLAPCTKNESEYNGSRIATTLHSLLQTPIRTTVRHLAAHDLAAHCSLLKAHSKCHSVNPPHLPGVSGGRASSLSIDQLPPCEQITYLLQHRMRYLILRINIASGK